MTDHFVCMLLMDILNCVCQHASLHSNMQKCTLNLCFKYLLSISIDVISWFFCVFVVSGSRLLQPAQVCDVLKGLILVLCFCMMHYVDYSMMYHLIRGQSVIKLYIIYNMLEVPHNLHTNIWHLYSVTFTQYKINISMHFQEVFCYLSNIKWQLCLIDVCNNTAANPCTVRGC